MIASMSSRSHSMARPPSYLSCSSLARELDMSETTVRDMVERGVLPKPVRLTSGCVRWCWEDVQMALAGAAGTAPAVSNDPYMVGVKNVTAAR